MPRLLMLLSMPTGASVVAGCDTTEFDCPQLLRDGADAQILAPVTGEAITDTVRLGEPFEFEARFTGGRGDEQQAGVSLEWALPSESPRVLYEQVLLPSLREGEVYTVRQTVVIDSLAGGVRPGDFDVRGRFLVGAYAAEHFSSCSGVVGGRAATTYTPVTVLD